MFCFCLWEIFMFSTSCEHDSLKNKWGTNFHFGVWLHIDLRKVTIKNGIATIEDGHHPANQHSYLLRKPCFLVLCCLKVKLWRPMRWSRPPLATPWHCHWACWIKFLPLLARIRHYVQTKTKNKKNKNYLCSYLSLYTVLLLPTWTPCTIPQQLESSVYCLFVSKSV